jgi:polyhydroxyalkanoate synthesis regulator phasin
MPTREELIAQASAKWEREQLISQAKAKWEASQSGPSESESALRGVASGVTAGFDDEFTGGVGAVGRVFGVKNLGSWKPFAEDSKLETTDEPLSADAIVEAYRSNRDAVREDQKADFAKNPKATIAGNLVGAFVSPAAKIKAPSKMGPLTRGATRAQAMKTAALQGAAFGAGTSEADLTKGDVAGFGKDVAANAALSAAVPPAVEAAKGVVKGAAKTAAWTGRKLFSSVFGVTEGNAQKYLARREAINAAPELAEIKNQVDDAVLQLSQEVDSGKIQVEQARERLADLKTQIRNSLTDAKVDAREALRRSEDLLKEAAAKTIQPLKDKRAPTQLATEVVDAVEDLKGKVTAESGRAQEVLSRASAQVDLAPVYNRIDETVEKLRTYGTAEADSIIGRLEDYKSKLMSENWATIGGEAAKRRLQGLDQITAYSPNAGAFDQALNAAFKGIRSELDLALKNQVPEYAKAMKPVAADADLLDDVARAFGEERKAISRLGQIATPKGKVDREALARLEQATGRPGAFTRPVDEFSRAQALLKDPAALEQMRRALPEYAAYRQAMAKLAKMKPDWSREQLERALSTSKEARALSLAEDALSRAQAKLKPVASLTPASTESKLKAFIKPGGAPIETQRAVKELERITGKQFTQSLEDRRVLDAFSKAHANGSRNTVLWTVVGFVTGGIPGAMAGATFGHSVIDRYGPKVGKAILDGIGKLRESPSIQTIRSLNLPENVKRELEREFRVYVTLKNAGELQPPRKVASDQGPDRAPSEFRGEERWARTGLQKLGISGSQGARLLEDKRTRRLLIQASDLPAGSKALQRIKDQIQKGPAK